MGRLREKRWETVTLKSVAAQQLSESVDQYGPSHRPTTSTPSMRAMKAQPYQGMSESPCATTQLSVILKAVVLQRNWEKAVARLT